MLSEISQTLSAPTPSTGFEESEIKPETGKLLVFSNSIYKHHVTKIEGAERFALNIWYNRK